MALTDRPFLALVRDDGLPLHRLASSTTPPGVNLALSPSSFTRWYWLVAKIDVHYRYKINTYIFQRTLTLDASAQKPSERSLHPPLLRHNVRDATAKLYTQAEISPHLAHFTDPGHCVLPFSFAEGDLAGHFQLQLRLPSVPPSQRLLHTYAATFLDNPVHFCLYTSHPKFTGTILEIQWTPIFFQILAN